VLFTACLLAALAEPSLAETRVRPGFNLFTTQQDVQIGAQSAAEIDRSVPLVSGGYPVRYVERIGQRLAAGAPGPGYPYRFRIANLSDVNAFALPGGYVYVHRGLIEQVRTEGELAGVIAHEIAHVALRHPTSQASKAYVTRAGIGLLGTLLGDGRQTTVSGIMNAVGGFGLNALFLRYSRNAETQADVVGAQIMARAGYDPRDMAGMFRIIAARGGAGGPEWLSDHPNPGNRSDYIVREARMLKVKGGVRDTGAFRETQIRLRRLPPPPSRQVTRR